MKCVVQSGSEGVPRTFIVEDMRMHVTKIVLVWISSAVVIPKEFSFLFGGRILMRK
jgi:hypothetical protein